MNFVYLDDNSVNTPHQPYIENRQKVTDKTSSQHLVFIKDNSNITSNLISFSLTCFEMSRLFPIYS